MKRFQLGGRQDWRDGGTVERSFPGERFGEHDAER
jgi:hypothetical protein